jgi:hypothetical protein
MQLFKNRVTGAAIQGFQWDGKPETIDRMRDWSGGRIRVRVRPHPPDLPDRPDDIVLSIQTETTLRNVGINDYAVMNGDRLYPMRKVELESMYDPVPVPPSPVFTQAT